MSRDAQRPRAALFWSGGKDSALALDRVRRAGELDLAALVTTIDPRVRRVAMHGVPTALVAAQAEALGLPLVEMAVASPDAYLPALETTLRRLRDQGVSRIVFGDIFLADLKAWREALLKAAGLTGAFPLWEASTDALAREFVDRGFKAVVCCAEDPALSADAVGRELDEAFFGDLPADADPCGENGEYHSFVYDGPGFARPVAFARGAPVYRPAGSAFGPGGFPAPAAPVGSRTRGFWFLDLKPAFAAADA